MSSQFQILQRLNAISEQINQLHIDILKLSVQKAQNNSFQYPRNNQRNNNHHRNNQHFRNNNRNKNNSVPPTVRIVAGPTTSNEEKIFRLN